MTRGETSSSRPLRKPGFVVYKKPDLAATEDRPSLRALVDFERLGVEMHAIIMARVPAGTRDEAVTTLTRHHRVLSCSTFTAEPMDIMIEVVGSATHRVQDFVAWARHQVGMEVRHFLPVERILQGGPTVLPRPDEVIPAPSGARKGGRKAKGHGAGR